MVDLEKLLKNKKLVEELTGLTEREFLEKIKIYKAKNKRKFKIIDTTEKQIFFICFTHHLLPSAPTLATFFGIEKNPRRRISDWKKILHVSIGEPHFKTIGHLLQAYPAIKDYLVPGEFHLPQQFSTSSTKDEMSRLKKTVNTLDKRTSMLIEFREEIMNRPENSPIDNFIYTLYCTKYKDLEQLEIKEMAYLWGVSIEYMTRVLNTAQNKLLSLNNKELKEKLIYDYE